MLTLKFMTRHILVLAMVLQACVTETGPDTVTDTDPAEPAVLTCRDTGCPSDSDCVYMADTGTVECQVACYGSCGNAPDAMACVMTGTPTAPEPLSAYHCLSQSRVP